MGFSPPPPPPPFPLNPLSVVENGIPSAYFSLTQGGALKNSEALFLHTIHSSDLHPLPARRPRRSWCSLNPFHCAREVLLRASAAAPRPPSLAIIH